MADLIVILIALVVLLRPGIGLYVVLFLLPFVPRYLGMAIGDEGFALTHRRVLTVSLFAGMVLYSFIHHRPVDRALRLIRAEWFICTLIAALFGAKLVATLTTSGIDRNLFYVFDDILLSLLVPLGILTFVQSQKDEFRIVVLIVGGLLATQLLMLVESIRGTGLLQGLVEISVEEAGRSGLDDRIRDGDYRAKGLFDNPLLMSEFVCLAWPWAMYLWRAGRSHGQRLLGLAALAGTPLAIYLGQTRSGWLVLGLGAFSYFFIRYWQRSRYPGRVLLAAIAVGLSVFVLKSAIDVVSNPQAYFAGSESAGRSAEARIQQFAYLSEAWSSSRLLGYGMTRNFGQDLEFLNNIDNYWLRLILEGGAIAVVLFAIILSWALMVGKNELTHAPDAAYRAFVTAAAVSMVSFVAYKLFVSMPTNNIYFFVIAALLMRRRRLRMHQDSAGATARTTRLAQIRPV